MEFYMIILCGILVGFGVYLMLSKSMMRIIIGVGLFGHAANLIILIADYMMEIFPLSQNWEKIILIQFQQH